MGALDRLEGLAEGRRALGAVVGVLGQTGHEQVGELGRHGFAQSGRGGVDDAHHHRRHRLVGLTLEGWTAREQGVQGGGQAVDVGALVLAPPPQHLGRDVGDGEAGHAGGGAPAAVHRGDAEVRQLGLAEGADEDVLGLEVAVQGAGGVGCAERAAHLDAGGHGRPPIERRPVGQGSIGQRALLEVLHGQPQVAGFGDARVVDGDDVRVPRQLAHGPALALEAVAGALVGVGQVQHLQRHGAVEAVLVGPVDAGEATPADLDQVSVARHLRERRHGGTLGFGPAACPPGRLRRG